MKVIDRVKYTFRYKYRKGHRIHSPYVFKLVRSLFMKKINHTVTACQPLVSQLCADGIKFDYSYRVGQFFDYNGFSKYSHNPLSYCGEDFIVLSKIDDNCSTIIEQMCSAKERSAVVVLNIYRNKECRMWWQMQDQLMLDIYRVGIIVYDNNLNREYFKLKI